MLYTKKKRKEKIIYLYIGECKKFIHHLFNIYIYIVYKNNILNKYKWLKYEPFKYKVI